MVRSGCRRRCDMTAAALLAAACAAFIHATHQVQPTAAQGSVPVVDNGFFTQVADFNAPVDMSGQANQAADTSGGALLRGALEPGLARQQVFLTKVVPFRYIGFLRCADGTRCTGALISPRHVLTAGHCVYDYRGTRQLRDSHPTYWPALSNNQSTITPPEAPYGQFRVSRIALPPQFTARNSNQAFDLAVLTLENATEAVGGYFQYDCFSDAAFAAADSAAGLTGGEGPVFPPPPPPPSPPPPSGSAPRNIAFQLNVAGYPASEDREMWAAFCANVTFDPSNAVLIQHECNTYSGMSGAPLWEYEPSTSSRRICAVHKADALLAGVENLAVPLYAAAVRFIDNAIGGRVRISDQTAAVLEDSLG